MQLKKNTLIAVIHNKAFGQINIWNDKFAMFFLYSAQAPSWPLCAPNVTLVTMALVAVGLWVTALQVD